MYCSKCGAENTDEAKFCKNCGAVLEENVEESIEESIQEPDQATGKKKKKKLWILLTTVIILMAVVCGIFFAMKAVEEKKAQDYQNYISQAEKYMEEVDYENAEDFYLKAISIDSKQKEIYVKLADIYLIQEEYDKAIEILEQAEENLGEADSYIEEKKKEIEERGEYVWIVEPTIEADDIYYLADYPDSDHCLNELSKQADNPNAVIQIGNEMGIIDLEGELLAEIAYKKIANYGDYYMMTRTTPQYSEEYNMDWDIYWLNENGEIYASVGNGSLTVPIYYYYEGSRYLVSGSKTIQEVIPVQESTKYIDTWDMYEYPSLWDLDGKYALDYNGELITDFIYDECGSLSDGLLAVCKAGKWGYVDEKGEVVIPIEYDASWKKYPVFNGGSSRSTDNVKDYCYAASDGYVALCKDENWELRDTTGKLVILPGIFEAIRPVYDGKCWVKKDGKWGVIQIEKKDSAEVTSEEEEDTVKEVSEDDRNITTAGQIKTAECKNNPRIQRCPR